MGQPVSHRSPPSLRGARILVVEDDAILAMELAAILQEAGAEVIGPCNTVADALAVNARTIDIAAAVLDVRIGRHTVAPVARQLWGNGTPFMFYTGQLAGDQTMAEWPDHKVIAKPANASTLVFAVAEMIGLRQTKVAQGTKSARSGF